MIISNHNDFPVLFDKIASVYFTGKYIHIVALETATPGNQHCASCISTLRSLLILDIETLHSQRSTTFETVKQRQAWSEKASASATSTDAYTDGQTSRKHNSDLFSFLHYFHPIIYIACLYYQFRWIKDVYTMPIRREFWRQVTFRLQQESLINQRVSEGLGLRVIVF